MTQCKVSTYKLEIVKLLEAKEPKLRDQSLFISRVGAEEKMVG